jgi:hypothetical protein
MADRPRPGADRRPSQPPGSQAHGSGSGGGNPDPTITVPAPRPKGGAREQFMAWAIRAGIARKLAANTWFWAQRYGPQGSKTAFAYYYAATLVAESGAKHRNPDGTLKSSGQAGGVAQIAFSWVGEPVPWEPGRTITRADIADPGFNLRFGAYLMSQAVAQYGFDGAYTQGYNPNDPNRFKAWDRIQSLLPKNMDFAPSSGPGENPSPGRPPVAATDPFVTVRNGKLVPVSDPGNALQLDGQPLTRSGYLQLKRSLEETWVSYTGRRPRDVEVANFVRKGWSGYSLLRALVNSKDFVNSPVYKRIAPGLKQSAQSLLGEDEQGDAQVMLGLVRQAALNNWDGNDFQAALRQRKGYVKSTEFKGIAETFHNVYSSIYGMPDEGGMRAIKEAAAGGWSTDQFAGWLRGQDAYTGSSEYQSRSLNFLSAIGLFTGSTPVLRPGTNAPLNGPPTEALPDDERLPGQGQANPTSNLTPGLM